MTNHRRDGEFELVIYPLIGADTGSEVNSVSSIKSSSTGWCFNFSVAGVPGIEDLLPLAIFEGDEGGDVTEFYYYVIDMEEELETSKRICIKTKK